MPYLTLVWMIFFLLLYFCDDISLVLTGHFQNSDWLELVFYLIFADNAVDNLKRRICLG